jgi:hypothetical protein
MMPFRHTLYIQALLVCAYAAGIRQNGRDYTGIPWWGDLLFGVVLFAIAIGLEWRAPGKARR